MEQHISYIKVMSCFIIGRENNDITQCCVEPWTDGVHVPIEVQYLQTTPASHSFNYTVNCFCSSRI